MSERIGVRGGRAGGRKKRTPSRRLRQANSKVIDIGEFRKKVAAATAQLCLPYGIAAT
jgi:hypothetical protein